MRTPATPTGCVLQEDRDTFVIRWVESGQSSRVLWCHSIALLALLGDGICADAFHDFFETLRLIEDRRLVAVVHCDIDAPAGKTDSSLAVRHAVPPLAPVLHR